MSILEQDVRWDYTQVMRLSHGETYGDRPHIGRDTPIDGGVYYGNYEAEATVVDTVKNPEQFEKLEETVEDIIAEWQDKHGVSRKKALLGAIESAVDQHLPYSQPTVDALNSTFGATNGRKMDLSVYLEARGGVCRHQALAFAVTVERYIKRGELGGEVSVDRNELWNPMEGAYDGHAWARYTNEKGKVFIIDIAQHVTKSLDEIIEGDNPEMWPYLRPEELTMVQKKKQLQKLGGWASAKTGSDPNLQ